jgi:signal transduction histidine kinase
VIAGAAAVLYVLTFLARLAIHDPDALIANFYVVPIALLAIEFGTRAGIGGAALGFALVPAWSVINAIHVGALGYVSRGGVMLGTGVVVGHFSERLRQDIAARRRAQHHLAVYADQLERANEHLAQSVLRLEAFADIARAVGGETNLERVLGLILAQGQEIIGARRLLIWLPDGDELVAVSPAPEPRARLPRHGSLAGEVLASERPRRLTAEQYPAELAELRPDASAAILVPLVFRGEALGVLAGIDRTDGREFQQEDEQLLLSVAASAATAVATARSVAAERLQLSLAAAEQARARWARELHDETLQGLTGVRMVLGAGLAREDSAALRRAAESADAHLAAEMRSLRDLITELRPAALDDLGLGPAIESLAKRQAAAGGFNVTVELELDAAARPRETEITIYRVVQEALSNIVKHADAERAFVAVRQSAARIDLTVQDDGRGFVPTDTREGFGLAGMRERALLVGAQLTVTSSAGGPTCVSASLPVPPTQAVGTGGSSS